MSTINDTDLLLVNRGGSSYKVTFANWDDAQGSDTLLVNRGGTSYKVTKDDIEDIQDSDLLLTERNGVSYKVTGVDFLGVVAKLEVVSQADTVLTLSTAVNLSNFTAGDVVEQQSPVTPVTSAITTSQSLSGNWVQTSSGAAAKYQAIASNGTTIVSLGGNGEIKYSTDGGVTWQTTSGGPTSNSVVTGMAYGAGKFVAVSSNSATPNIWYSSDGFNWTGTTSALNSGAQFYDVIYADGKFVAVSIQFGSNTQTVITYSTDGMSWTAASVIAGQNWNAGFSSVAYGNASNAGTNMFVAVPLNGSMHPYTSPDGMTWTRQDATTVSIKWQSVTFGNGKFVACSPQTTTGIYYSTDGVTWSAGNESSGTGIAQWYSVTFGDGTFTAISNYGKGPKAIYSTDGINWTTAPLGTDEMDTFIAVNYVDGMFIAIEYDTTDQFFYSYSANPNVNKQLLTFQDGTQLNNFQPGDPAQPGGAPGNIGAYTISGNSYGSDYPWERCFSGALVNLPGALGSGSGGYKIEFDTPLTANSVLILSNNSSSGLDSIYVSGRKLSEVGTNLGTTTAPDGSSVYQYQISTTISYISIGDVIQLQGCRDSNGVYWDIGTKVSSVTPASNQMVVNGGTWTNGDTVRGTNIDGGSIVQSVDIANKTLTMVTYDRFAIGSSIEEFVGLIPGNWTTTIPDSSGAGTTNNTTYNGTAYSPDDDVWLVVGFNGDTLQFIGGRSTNGAASWTPMVNQSNGGSIPTRYSPQNLKYGGGRFVMVANSDQANISQAVWYSSDGGLTWSTGNNLTQNPNWRGLAYSPTLDVWVMCAVQGKFAYSTDGAVNWTIDSDTDAYTWNSVAWGNGKFVAMDSTGTTRVSTDGINWTINIHSCPVVEIYNIVYDSTHDKFCVTGSSNTTRGTDAAATSSDGVNWTSSSTIPSGNWRCLAYGAGRLVAVSDNNNDTAYITSTDGGVNWYQGVIVPAPVGYLPNPGFGDGVFNFAARGGVSAYIED